MHWPALQCRKAWKQKTNIVDHRRKTKEKVIIFTIMIIYLTTFEFLEMWDCVKTAVILKQLIQYFCQRLHNSCILILLV